LNFIDRYFEGPTMTIFYGMPFDKTVLIVMHQLYKTIFANDSQDFLKYFKEKIEDGNGGIVINGFSAKIVQNLGTTEPQELCDARLCQKPLLSLPLK
jgi:hypothetical protein